LQTVEKNTHVLKRTVGDVQNNRRFSGRNLKFGDLIELSPLEKDAKFEVFDEILVENTVFVKILKLNLNFGLTH